MNTTQCGPTNNIVTLPTVCDKFPRHSKTLPKRNATKPTRKRFYKVLETENFIVLLGHNQRSVENDAGNAAVYEEIQMYLNHTHIIEDCQKQYASSVEKLCKGVLFSGLILTSCVFCLFYFQLKSPLDWFVIRWKRKSTFKKTKKNWRKNRKV